jgi:hypothetical protein
MVVVETSVFTRQLQAFLSDEEYAKLQVALVQRPDLGKAIRSSGGLRKMRWSLPGRGKRGGVRVIYFWAADQDQLLMLFLYPKAEREDLSPAQLKLLKKVVEEAYP